MRSLTAGWETKSELAARSEAAVPNDGQENSDILCLDSHKEIL